MKMKLILYRSVILFYFQNNILDIHLDKLIKDKNKHLKHIQCNLHQFDLCIVYNFGDKAHMILLLNFYKTHRDSSKDICFNKLQKGVHKFGINRQLVLYIISSQIDIISNLSYLCLNNILQDISQSMNFEKESFLKYIQNNLDQFDLCIVYNFGDKDHMILLLNFYKIHRDSSKGICFNKLQKGVHTFGINRQLALYIISSQINIISNLSYLCLNNILQDISQSMNFEKESFLKYIQNNLDQFDLCIVYNFGDKDHMILLLNFYKIHRDSSKGICFNKLQKGVHTFGINRQLALYIISSQINIISNLSYLCLNNILLDISQSINFEKESFLKYTQSNLYLFDLRIFYNFGGKGHTFYL